MSRTIQQHADANSIGRDPISHKARLATFDVAKGLAVLLMVMIHVLDFYGLPEVRFGTFGSTLKFAVGWPAASMFVFIMGLFVTWSGNKGLRQDIILRKELQRAAGLFALGYLLNLTRSSIPMWLSIEIGLVTYADVAPHTPISELLIVDVFQFAGLALLICALLRRALPHPTFWLLAALAVAFVSPLLWDVSTGNGFIDEVLKLFVGNEAQGVMFPLFPWLAYPLAGMALGDWLRRKQDISFALQRSMLAGWVLMALAALLVFSNPVYHIADNLRSGPGLVVFFIGLILVFLWSCHSLVQRIAKNNKILCLVSFWGERVTAMYIVHWLLIGWGLMLFGLQQMNLSQNLLAMLGVLILSDLLVRAWCQLGKYKNRRKQIGTQQHIKAGASLS